MKFDAEDETLDKVQEQTLHKFNSMEFSVWPPFL